MIIRDISLSSPLENILYDDVLLALAESAGSGPSLRLWESPNTFVVLGRTGKLVDDVFLGRVREDRVPVLRRSSGGGTVVQGQGCLNFSYILPKGSRPGLADITKSYRVIMNDVIAILSGCGFACRFEPPCDLVAEGSGRKVSGNAQRRGRTHILHHGTLLYDLDLERVSRYLRMPARVPEYRQGRTHDDFIMNLPLDLKELKNCFLGFHDMPDPIVEMDLAEKEQLSALCAKKRDEVVLSG